MKLVAFTGPAGCGKNTAADFLIRDYGFAEMRFASPLKRGICAMFGWSREQIDGATPEYREWRETVIPELGFSPRKAMQTLGTEWGRGLNEELWLILAGYELAALRPRVPGVVITDLRFDNEARWVRYRNGYVIALERNVASIAAHSSERGVTPLWLTATVENNGTLEQLRKAVIQAALS